MGILNEYEEVLIGSRKKISSCYFLFNKKGNERVALTVIRYAIEKLLGWNQDNAIMLLNNNYISFMKLDQMMKYIVFPSDVSKEDIDYLLYLLYPKKINYDVQKYTLRVYDNVINNKGRYPKDYMYGYLGLLRARICLQHVLQTGKIFKSTDELYKFFSSKDSVKYMKQKKLYQLYINFYDSPLEYMHCSLPQNTKNEFLFHNYMFMQQYQALQNQKNVEKNKKA